MAHAVSMLLQTVSVNIALQARNILYAVCKTANMQQESTGVETRYENFIDGGVRNLQLVSFISQLGGITV